MTTAVPAVQIPADADLEKILRLLTKQKTTAKDPVAVAEATKAVEVTEKAREALVTLYELLGTVELPVDRREMTPEELEAAADLKETANQATQAVAKSIEEVRNVVFNHFDLWLEAEEGAKPGEASYEQDDDGHYLVKQEVFVPSRNVRLTRELAENAPKVVAKDLKTLSEAGKITRADYYRATKRPEVPRVVDPEGFAQLLKDKPELLEVISGAITPGTVTGKFWVRPPKKGK